MENASELRYVAFAGTRNLVEGTLGEVLPVLKQRHDRQPSEMILVFDCETGRQVDFNLQGDLVEVVTRATAATQRGPGRPKLGVMGREVSLLPRHWEWLEQQPQGISGALRRLVEKAMKLAPGEERARRIREAVNAFLGSIAGDRPNYEEATRALFRGDVDGFDSLTRRWPEDIREWALGRVREAARLSSK